MPRWTVHLEGGPRRVNHAAISVGCLIFSFGGYCTGEDYETTRPIDVHVLDTNCYRWRPLAFTYVPLPEQEPKEAEEKLEGEKNDTDSEDEPESPVPYQRYGHTAVNYGRIAYIWGGRNDDKGASNTLHAFDTRKHEWSIVEVTGNVPGARDGHSACVIGHKMFIFGGYEERFDSFSNQVHQFDFNTSVWTLIMAAGQPAKWRDFQSSTGIDNVMYVFGGRGDRQGPYHTNHEVYCNELQAFDTLAKTWYKPVPVGAIPAGRRSHSAFVYRNELYVFGGYNGIQDVHFSDIYKYNPIANRWSLVKTTGDGPCPRRRQCCCVIGDRVFLFGGTSPCPVPMEGLDVNLMDHSDLYVLDFSPTLKTLCLLRIMELRLDVDELPRDLQHEILLMTTNNSISRPLGTNG